MASRAIQAELLQQRIRENRASQEIDLTTWIFDRMRVRPHDRVLELCCGTGGQTLKFLDLLQGSGRLVAIDASRDALNTLRGRLQSGVSNVELIEGDLDRLGPQLEQSGEKAPAFDLIFCAYGLYYSTNAPRLLDELRCWLNADGRIVVVGPYGPNNGPLFDLVRASGGTISEPVLESSERFMSHTVLPWSARNFESVSVHTMVNRVRWQTPERVLNYWQNTTFFETSAQPKFVELLQSHFELNGEFVNEKWIMMMEMAHAR